MKEKTNVNGTVVDIDYESGIGYITSESGEEVIFYIGNSPHARIKIGTKVEFAIKKEGGELIARKIKIH